MDWIKNNPETTATALFGVLALAVALWIALWQNRPKWLDYQVRTRVTILSTHATSLGSKLTVAYRGTPLQDPHLAIVRIQNTGKQPVLRSDFTDPIAIVCRDNQPVAWSVSDESAEGLAGDDVWDLETGGVLFEPQLMNRGEWFDVQLLSDGPPGRISVTSRFLDQSRPMRPYVSGRDATLPLPQALLTGLIGAFITSITLTAVGAPRAQALVVIPIVFGVTVIGQSVFRGLSKERRN